jgi:ABC-type transporter Mla MlaB component
LKARQVEVLRIESLNENELLTLRVEGKLVGPWVRELEQCWQRVVAERPPRLVRINLSSVGFIDSEGKQLLCRMRREGAVLVPTGCFMKSIVDEIEREASKE